MGRKPALDLHAVTVARKSSAADRLEELYGEALGGVAYGD
jgi:hypothetical protein